MMVGKSAESLFSPNPNLATAEMVSILEGLSQVLTGVLGDDWQPDTEVTLKLTKAQLFTLVLLLKHGLAGG